MVSRTLARGRREWSSKRKNASYLSVERRFATSWQFRTGPVAVAGGTKHHLRGLQHHVVMRQIHSLQFFGRRHLFVRHGRVRLEQFLKTRRLI